MTTRTFTPSVSPAAPLEISVESSINKIEFGDGYSEDSARGINAQRRVAQLSWVLKKEQASVIHSFLQKESGWGRIRYTLPGDTADALWIVTELSLTRGAGESVTLTATFSETFL